MKSVNLQTKMKIIPQVLDVDVEEIPQSYRKNWKNLIRSLQMLKHQKTKAGS